MSEWIELAIWLAAALGYLIAAVLAGVGVIAFMEKVADKSAEKTDIDHGMIGMLAIVWPVVICSAAVVLLFLCLGRASEIVFQLLRGEK